MSPNRKILWLGSLFLMFLPLSAQIPKGYYAKAEGKYGASLKNALHQVIANPKVLSYGELWSAFESTDTLVVTECGIFILLVLTEIQPFL